MEPKRPFYPGDLLSGLGAASNEVAVGSPAVRVLREHEESGYFRKPESMSKCSTHSLPMFWNDRAYFIDSQMQAIEAYVSQQGLTLNLMTELDVNSVISFLYQRYPAEIASEISAFDLWRFMEYGHGVLLWDDTGHVKGCIFEIGYSRRPGTSFTIRLAVDKEIEGKNLGYHLMVYSSLLAMKEGAKVKRGLIQLTNQKSLYINLNKVGWICESFIPDTCGLGPFFDIALPLDPGGLFTNAVDMDRAKAYLNSHQEYIDYRLIDADDECAVANLYEHTDFKIVAMFKKGDISAGPCFLALPAGAIGLQQL